MQKKLACTVGRKNNFLCTVLVSRLRNKLFVSVLYHILRSLMVLRTGIAVYKFFLLPLSMISCSRIDTCGVITFDIDVNLNKLTMTQGFPSFFPSLFYLKLLERELLNKKVESINRCDSEQRSDRPWEWTFSKPRVFPAQSTSTISNCDRSRDRYRISFCPSYANRWLYTRVHMFFYTDRQSPRTFSSGFFFLVLVNRSNSSYFSAANSNETTRSLSSIYGIVKTALTGPSCTSETRFNVQFCRVWQTRRKKKTWHA